MNINDLNTLEQLKQFLTGSQAVAFFVASSKDRCYQGSGDTPSLKNVQKAVVSFLVKQYRDNRKIKQQ